MRLAELQAAYRGYLLSGDSAALAPAIVADSFDGPERLAIYRNNFLISLGEALKANFPVTRQLLGTDFSVGFWVGAEGALLLYLSIIVVYAVLTRPTSGPAQQAELARAMPGGYELVLSALIRASGQECDSLCSASIAEPVVGMRRVEASCAVAARHITCAQALAFEINISPAPRPSR